jgi:hypothetical protein
VPGPIERCARGWSGGAAWRFRDHELANGSDAGAGARDRARQRTLRLANTPIKKPPDLEIARVRSVV